MDKRDLYRLENVSTYAETYWQGIARGDLQVQIHQHHFSTRNRHELRYRSIHASINSRSWLYRF